MCVILIPSSPGELIDKITILQIKHERFTDALKLANVRHELDVLNDTASQVLAPSDRLTHLWADLKKTNEALWDVEDEIRGCDQAGEFGPRFVELARSVYRHNDVRCGLKRQINELLGCELIEEKGYRVG
jgi:hypothetical protein